jgi:hypothetical protein
MVTARAARRAGVSSIPLSPTSASSRSIDWSSDVNVIGMNWDAAQTARQEGGDRRRADHPVGRRVA